ncbi:hypothetical protein ACFQJ7_13080 [Halovenus rubra]|uniref:Uncharacterized protein n=2 Tax=Halovenus rubra TaxID=869890 RepID=A0ABD5X6W9_9EURY|nr:hypothetical protein [Halovenus rubra]
MNNKYDSVSKVTLDGILQTLPNFLEFRASIDVVEDGIREQVIMLSTIKSIPSSHNDWLRNVRGKPTNDCTATNRMRRL